MKEKALLQEIQELKKKLTEKGHLVNRVLQEKAPIINWFLQKTLREY